MEQDSNLRSPKAPDLQSGAIDRSAIHAFITSAHFITKHLHIQGINILYSKAFQKLFKVAMEEARVELSDDEKQLLRDLEDANAITYTTKIPTLSRLTPLRQKKIPRQFPLFNKIENNCDGHFLLTSGRHTNVFIQTALGLRYVNISQSIGFRLYKLLKEKNLLGSVDVLIGPPVGAISVINALLYAINSTKIEAMYLERNSEGKFLLGRGFELNADKRVLLVDDVFSTGSSLRKTIAICNEASADEDGAECQFVGAAVVVNRASNKEVFKLASTTIPVIAALTYPIQDWSDEECPYCAYDIPLYKL